MCKRSSWASKNALLSGISLLSHSIYRFCLIPTVDKPTRVHRNSATLIDNIFVNNPDQIIAGGNIISDISDHFSQFCIAKQ